MSKRPTKVRRRRSRIVPAAVFAASVAIGAVPALAGCGGSQLDVQEQPGVAAQPPDDQMQPGVAVLPPDDQMQPGVAAPPPEVYGVAAPPPGE